MLRKMTDMFGFHIQATDDSIGRVDDMLFDDDWQVRYFVVDTGPWLLGRRVLVAAAQVEEPDWPGRSLPVALTKEQVRESPDIDLTRPITREYETALHQYYNWPAYWVPAGAPGTMLPGTAVSPAPATPGIPAEAAKLEERALRRAESERAALQSVKDVTGHAIAATDGHIGYLDDFFVDETGWCINYLLVDTGKWLPGRKVLISPEWVTTLDWDNEVILKVSKAQVKDSPEYDPAEAPSREYVSHLYDYYGFPMH